MFETILVTGAAGVGKSTLAQSLAPQQIFAVFDYGAELTKFASRGAKVFTQEDVRRDSARIVKEEHVAATDQALLEFIHLHRPNGHVVIASHAVTKEPYGFRSVPFTPFRLQGAAFSRIIVLQCQAAVLVDRIDRNPQGRTRISLAEAKEHMALQATVAIAYSVASGIPVHFLDCDLDADSVRSVFLDIVGTPLH